MTRVDQTILTKTKAQQKQTGIWKREIETNGRTWRDICPGADQKRAVKEEAEDILE